MPHAGLRFAATSCNSHAVFGAEGHAERASDTLSLPRSTSYTDLGSALLLGEPLPLVRREKKQGFYSAGNIRTTAAPPNSARLTAFPSNALGVNYSLH